MEPTLVDRLIQIIPLLFTGGGLYVLWRGSKSARRAVNSGARKDDAETDSIVQENYNKVVERLSATDDKVLAMREKQLDSTEEIRSQAAELRSMNRTIVRLRRQVDTLKTDLKAWQSLAEQRLLKIDGMPDEIEALRNGLRSIAKRTTDQATIAEIETIIGQAARLSDASRAAPDEQPIAESEDESDENGDDG